MSLSFFLPGILFQLSPSQTLQGAIRQPSPTAHFDPDESTDTIIFAPELNVLAREIAAGRGSSVAPESEAATSTTGGDKIIFTVKWQPHPLDPQAQHGVEWQYRTDRVNSLCILLCKREKDAHSFYFYLDRQLPRFIRSDCRGCQYSSLQSHHDIPRQTVLPLCDTADSQNLDGQR